MNSYRSPRSQIDYVKLYLVAVTLFFIGEAFFQLAAKYKEWDRYKQKEEALDDAWQVDSQRPQEPIIIPSRNKIHHL